MTINNSPDIKFDLGACSTYSQPHDNLQKDGIVLGALIPAYCAMIYFFGYGVLIQFLICANFMLRCREYLPLFYVKENLFFI